MTDLTNIPQEMPEGYIEHWVHNNATYITYGPLCGVGIDNYEQAWQHYHIGQICRWILGV